MIRLAYLGFAAVLMVSVTSYPAVAQLVSEQLSDTNRICTYAGSDMSASGQEVARTAIVGLGQDCPSTAPYRSPDAPVPPNASFRGEQTTSSNRLCLYSEGGIDYQVTINLSQRCAMTPALLQQELTATR